jgi:hypothetical protein
LRRHCERSEAIQTLPRDERQSYWFPQDRFAIRENEIARKSSRRRADCRASGIRFPN